MSHFVTLEFILEYFQVWTIKFVNRCPRNKGKFTKPFRYYIFCHAQFVWLASKSLKTCSTNGIWLPDCKKLGTLFMFTFNFPLPSQCSMWLTQNNFSIKSFFSPKNRRCEVVNNYEIRNIYKNNRPFRCISWCHFFGFSY